MNYYQEGQTFAESEFEDDQPYDPNATHQSPDMTAKDVEDWVQGYYNFWKSKNFSLDR